MSNDDKLVKVLSSLYESVFCPDCGTRLRLGDLDCPHCGLDTDEPFRQWAAALLRKLDA